MGENGEWRGCRERGISFRAFFFFGKSDSVDMRFGHLSAVKDKGSKPVLKSVSPEGADL